MKIRCSPVVIRSVWAAVRSVFRESLDLLGSELRLIWIWDVVR